MWWMLGDYDNHVWVILHFVRICATILIAPSALFLMLPVDRSQSDGHITIYSDAVVT